MMIKAAAPKLDTMLLMLGTSGRYRMLSGSSVISVGADLAAENPIGITRVSNDNRHEHRRTHQHEDLACFWRRSLPDRDLLGYNVREHTNPEANKAEQKQCERDE